MAKKTFVLDTNVILHDHECIHSFEDNDVVLPITVLEELDQFKRGSDQINYNAREFIRVLDGLSGDKIVKGGTRIHPKGGKIRIVTEHLQEPEVTKVFTENRPDRRILSVACWLSRQKRPGNGQVVLVSKDVNLRLKAKSLEIVAQDYFTDRVQDIDQLYMGKRAVHGFPGELISRPLYAALAEAHLRGVVRRARRRANE